jgi:acyl dehydratase
VDIRQINEQWVGTPCGTTTYEVDAERLLAFATACGETDPRFVDPASPDFQAAPGFTTIVVSGRGADSFPEGFPRLEGRSIDGGKSVEIHAPIRPGDTLRGDQKIADIYEKTGRSGRMVFVVHRTEFTNQHGDPVTTVDWRWITNLVEDGEGA